MESHASDRGSLPKVTIVTHSPSPYQVELFDKIEQLRKLDLKVLYLYGRDPQRLWQSPSAHHANVTLPHQGVDALGELERTDAADLLVINYYKHPFAKAAMQRRAQSSAAMCFWGERPQRPALSALSRVLRKRRLRFLLRTCAPIWGIGSMAVDAYRREFGANRTYVDLPYFSDLRRFSEAGHNSDDATCVFLFSGALSHRKGVDLLASAFARLAPNFPGARLRVMGCGSMEAFMRQRLQGCMDRVEFTGFLDWKDLPLEYAKADILCVPSRHDGWGLVVPEGLAAGLPVISTRQTGAAVDFIEPGENGWLIPENDEEALYRAMSEAASLGVKQRSEMSSFARQSVAAHSLENGAQRFVEAANAALADWKPSRRSAGALAS
jgi:glycosyltransferase involved in cell wall biosynthesis